MLVKLGHKLNKIQTDDMALNEANSKTQLT
jgi:hypothetical protein